MADTSAAQQAAAPPATASAASNSPHHSASDDAVAAVAAHDHDGDSGDSSSSGSLLGIRTTRLQPFNVFKESSAADLLDARSVGRGLLKSLLLACVVLASLLLFIRYHYRSQTFSDRLVAGEQELSAVPYYLFMGLAALPMTRSVRCPCEKPVRLGDIAFPSFAGMKLPPPTAATGTSGNSSPSVAPVGLQWHEFCNRDYASDSQSALTLLQTLCVNSSVVNAAPAEVANVCQQLNLQNMDQRHQPDPIDSARKDLSRLDSYCLFLHQMMESEHEQLRHSFLNSPNALNPRELFDQLGSMGAVAFQRYLSTINNLHAFIRFWETVSNPILGYGYRPVPLHNAYRNDEDIHDAKADQRSVFSRNAMFYGRPTAISASATGPYTIPADHPSVNINADSDGVKRDPIMLLMRRRKEDRPAGFQGRLCEELWDPEHCSALYDFVKEDLTNNTLIKFVMEHSRNPATDPAAAARAHASANSTRVQSIDDSKETGFVTFYTPQLYINHSLYYEQCGAKECTWVAERRVWLLEGVALVIGSVGGVVGVASPFIAFLVDAFFSMWEKRKQKKQDAGSYQRVKEQ